MAAVPPSCLVHAGQGKTEDRAALVKEIVWLLIGVNGKFCMCSFFLILKGDLFRLFAQILAKKLVDFSTCIFLVSVLEYA
jgi:hypothetical protein